MGGLHDLHVGFESHHPGGKVHGSEFGFGVPWRHVDNESLDLAFGDLRELIGKYFVVIALDKLRPYVFYVIQKGFLYLPLFVQVFQSLLQQEDLSHCIYRYMSQVRHRSHYNVFCFFIQLFVLNVIIYTKA